MHGIFGVDARLGEGHEKGFLLRVGERFGKLEQLTVKVAAVNLVLFKITYELVGWKCTVCKFLNERQRNNFFLHGLALLPDVGCPGRVFLFFRFTA